MGLDMDFYAVKNGEKQNIGYLRKHSVLHDFLLKEWLRHNPAKCISDFNCVEMEITKDFLPSLVKFCRKSSMNRTHYKEELFWGVSTEDDWRDMNETILPNIVKEIKEGNTVLYVPWWQLQKST